jgi:dethiobiotin synthetase
MRLNPATIPGLFITGTDTGVGKTVVAGAIAQWFRDQNKRVAVCKPVATGCIKRREGLVSEDAEFLAVCAKSPHPLDLICPQRYYEPLAPAIAAQRAKQPLDWESINRSISIMSKDSDVIIVEGVGGVRVPLDEKNTLIDLISALALPVIIVARAGLGTINHTLLTFDVLRQAGAKIAGVVINRYPQGTADTAEETNPRAIERWGKAPVLSIVPEAAISGPAIPDDIAGIIAQTDWMALL